MTPPTDDPSPVDAPVAPPPPEVGERIRREPPRFRRVVVRRVEEVGARMRRLVLGGDELDGFVLDEPAASVRVLLPDADGRLTLPVWTGNQFEQADGSRARIRTFTPRHHDPVAGELAIDVVLHGGGAAGAWAAAAVPGTEAAVSGPGRGYEPPADLDAILLAGDETALPAIGQLLEALAPEVAVSVLVDLADPAGRIDLPAHPGATVEWLVTPAGAEPGSALVEALAGRGELPPVLWVAGEAAAVQRIRTDLFGERGLARSAATVRGYWKKGRAATT